MASEIRKRKEKWGYPFGVDGVVLLKEACETLATSEDTIYRLAEQGKLRLGRHAGNKKRGRTVVCKKSMVAYLNSIELVTT